MTVQEANKIIDKVLKEDSVEAGIFISMLSNEYIKQSNITEEQFIKSLKNSLKILKKESEVN